MSKNAKLKSLFILPAIMVSMGLLVYSVVSALVADGDRLAWIGAALAALPLPLLMMRLGLMSTARTSENLPLLLLVSLSGAFLATWETYFGGTAGPAPVVTSVVAALLLLLYVLWYSRFGRHPDARIDVGSKLPEFRLTDIEGKPFSSTEVVGRPAVFLFYRGNWCPLCMAQIGELVERYAEMEKLGITVCLISPQPEEHTKALAEKFDVPFRFLVDHDNKVAESLEIAARNGVPVGVSGGYGSDTVMPTVIVTNAADTIVFSDQTDNYRVRPEPDTFLAILRRVGAIAA